jgi:hypothetical protein
MRSIGDDLLKASEYAEDEDDLNIIQRSYWSEMRSYLYKKICKGPEGRIQWDYLAGKRSRHANGKRILLSDRNTKILQNQVDYYSTTEGLEELEKYDIFPAPENIDDLMNRLCEAPLDREMKKEEFKLFLKHKHEIMRFLLR